MKKEIAELEQLLAGTNQVRTVFRLMGLPTFIECLLPLDVSIDIVTQETEGNERSR